jgi:hypothetical protein
VSKGRSPQPYEIATVLTSDQNAKWEKLKGEHAAERAQHQQ